MAASVYEVVNKPHFSRALIPHKCPLCAVQQTQRMHWLLLEQWQCHYDNLLTFFLGGEVFLQPKRVEIPLWNISFFWQNMLFSHHACWHFSAWPQLGILIRSSHWVEHLNNNTLKHIHTCFWSPFKLCPRVSMLIPAMRHGSSAVQFQIPSVLYWKIWTCFITLTEKQPVS